MRRRYKQKLGTGFTLVELLVVIGIIGVLATVSVASLNSARQKARDTRRITDVKQLSTILEAEDASTPGQQLTGCETALLKTSVCTGPGDGISKNFPAVLDPSTNNKADPCKDEAKLCDYSIANKQGNGRAKTNDYEICFYLESGGAGLSSGVNHIETGGILGVGCTIAP